MRIGFMGTPDFAVAVLKSLHQAGHDIAVVYTQPPRPSGRGQKSKASPVQIYSEAHHIPVKTAFRLRDNHDEHDFWQKLNLDIGVIVAYGMILPQIMLDSPTFGCLNAHASLLPRWRGAAPIERALLSGDTITGIGIMKMEAGLDTGPVYLQSTIPILGQDTGQSLHDKLALSAAELMVQTIDRIDKKFIPTPQSVQGITYAKKIEKAEMKIDWQESSADFIGRQIRTFSHNTGAWCMMGEERLKIHQAEIIDFPNDQAGILYKREQLITCCNNLAISPLSLQRQGGKATISKDFFNGIPHDRYILT